MTKEELKRISSNNQKISKLKERYAALKFKSQANGQVLTGMPHVSGTSDTVGDYVAELTGIREEILYMELETELLIKRARRFIAEIPDVIIQQILELKYINNLYEGEIAYMTGCSEIRTEKDVDRILRIFFLETLLYL